MMTRTYSVKFKSKSKMLTDEESIKNTENAILEESKAKAAKVEDAGQIVTIEADEEDFVSVMNTVVNVFRKIDDKSEVSYKFGLNRN